MLNYFEITINILIVIRITRKKDETMTKALNTKTLSFVDKEGNENNIKFAFGYIALSSAQETYGQPYINLFIDDENNKNVEWKRVFLKDVLIQNPDEFSIIHIL